MTSWRARLAGGARRLWARPAYAVSGAFRPRSTGQSPPVGAPPGFEPERTSTWSAQFQVLTGRVASRFPPVRRQNRYAPKSLGFSPPRPGSASRSWYARPGERISLFLRGGIAQDLTRYAGPAQSHNGAFSLCARILPKPQGAGDRGVGPAPATRDVRPDATKAQAHASRSHLLGRSVPLLASLERGPRHRQAGHGRPLAPQGIPALLADHLEAWPWAIAGFEGSTSTHPSFRPGERLGSTEGSCRT